VARQPHPVQVVGQAGIPIGQSWAIIAFTTITIPGDERSRTAPGHGYPEYQQAMTDILLFPTEEEWKAEIQRRHGLVSEHEKDFVAVILTRPTIKTKFVISVEIE
jgi:hypothetical protein